LGRRATGGGRRLPRSSQRVEQLRCALPLRVRLAPGGSQNVKLHYSYRPTDSRVTRVGTAGGERRGATPLRQVIAFMQQSATTHRSVG